MGLAERHAALRAAGGLIVGLGRDVVGVNLVKIAATLRGLALVRRFLLHRDEAEHALLSHLSPTGLFASRFITGVSDGRNEKSGI